jgi:hypothetical protein
MGEPSILRQPVGGGLSPVWLRILRSGGGYSCAFSLDAESWTTWRQTLPWEFYGPDYAGLIAENGEHATRDSLPAHFDFFEMRGVELRSGLPQAAASVNK